MAPPHNNRTDAAPVPARMSWAARGRRPVFAAAVAVGVGLLLAGCGEADPVEVGGAASSAALPSAPVASSAAGGTPSPSGSDAGAAELKIVVDEGGGQPTTWQLTCDPVGGTHPDAQAACGALGRAGAQALTPPKPGSAVCAQVFGGPQVATITGTWRGNAVSTKITRQDGCEIGRWDALAGLLPPAGS